MARLETLVDIYENAIETYPDNELFGTKRAGKWQWTSYLDFARATDAFRAGLASLGVGRGDRIAIISNNRPEWAVAAYATFGLGAAIVGMYEAQHPKDWDFIVKDCEAKALIVTTDAICEKTKPLLETAPTLKTIISMDPATKTSDDVRSFAELSSSKIRAPAIKPSPTDIASFIYTSGTTGNPKGVVLSHRNVAANVSAVHAVFPMSAADRSLSFLPWALSFGQNCELHALLAVGAGLAISEGTVDNVLENLRETKPTLFFGVPRVFNRLCAAVKAELAMKPAFLQRWVKVALAARVKKHKGEVISPAEILAIALMDPWVLAKLRTHFGGRLKLVFSGGAAMARELAELIDGLGITVYEGYGLTETSLVTLANLRTNRKTGSVGRPIPGVKISIGDDQEIIVKSPNVMLRYNRKEDNDAAFTTDGGCRTGDMGRIDDDGFLYITGRIKEQYKLENGRYVVPTPIEEQLRLSPYILNAMVYGDGKPFNVALLVANIDAVRSWARANGVTESDGQKLLNDTKVRGLFTQEVERVGAKFKAYEGVKDFVLVSEDFSVQNGLLTASLKLKRQKVLEKYLALLEALYSKKAERAAQP